MFNTMHIIYFKSIFLYVHFLFNSKIFYGAWIEKG
jgi:hypothetical protein